MCLAGRRLCDFTAGTIDKPRRLPDVVEPRLTQTTDGLWIVVAYKIAYRDGDGFQALTGAHYPEDARAECHRDDRHRAPDPRCTCGFHAVSDAESGLPWPVAPSKSSDSLTTLVVDRLRRRIMAAAFRDRPVMLRVALSGRILAFEYHGKSVLFRAERQTVMDVYDHAGEPDDLRGTRARLTPRRPVDAGPIRLELPGLSPPVVALEDDAGFCMLMPARSTRETSPRPSEPARV